MDLAGKPQDNIYAVKEDRQGFEKDRKQKSCRYVANRIECSKSGFLNEDEFSASSITLNQKRIECTYEVLLAVKSKLQGLKMSEQFAPKPMARRPPVPCPKLPRTFGAKQSKTGNYSYAEIEFRPMIITEQGAISAPLEGAPEGFAVHDGNVIAKNPTDNYEWDDDVGIYGDEKTYAGVDSNVVQGAGCHQQGDGEAPPFANVDQMRETIIGAEPLAEVSPLFEGDNYGDVGIYDTPIEVVSQKGVDISQLYAAVDFSKKKKKKNTNMEQIKSENKIEDNTNNCGENTNPLSQCARDHVPVDVGKSKFFIKIPERRQGGPPPIPKPFGAQRKKSAPAMLIHASIPPLPPRSKGIDELRDNDLGSTEDDAYASITESIAKKPSKGHRRNHSADFREADKIGEEPASSGTAAGKSSGKKGFKKQHRIMKSHETITTVFNQSPSQSKTDLTAISGKSSAESSLGDSASVSKESQDSSGENLYADVDMKELLQKAEALVTDDLPEGWQEVRDGSEIYYWHIWTGTIQYERPVLSATPSSSSRSLSPSFSDPNSSQSPIVTEQEKALQSKSPDARPESPQEKPKQAISFPVHSMGWVDVEEDRMVNDMLAETVNECISSLAEQRKDLWAISETWGEGKDIKLILEGEALKLVEPKSKAMLLSQPIAKMRVWGVGKEDQRDFAYIARDPKTNKHKCHMFRCHGNVSGRSIANTLHMICNRVLEEKRKAKERISRSQKQGSDLLNAPVSSSARGNTSFNEKPYFEQKKCFSAKYVGWTEVGRSSGIETLNKAVSKLTAIREPSEWQTVLLEITTSEVKTIDCSNQSILMEDRVRFISFLGVAKDQRMCGYIVAVGMDTFVCHVFCCSPNAGTLTRAIEEACKLRYEKFLHKTSEENRPKPPAASSPQMSQQKTTATAKEGKSSVLKSSVQGLFSKLQKRDSKKKLDGTAVMSTDRKSPPLQPGVNEFLVKYFGCVEVELGTGIETVQDSVEKLSRGAMMIGYLEITKGGLTLCDSQRTALSRRVIDLDTVSYCGITSDKHHFGLIVSQGRGKYACHVCQEYKTPVEKIVSAVHDML